MSTSDENEHTLRKCFQVLLQVIPPDTFYGNKTGHKVIIPNNCDELRSSLDKAWPKYYLFLCISHILHQVRCCTEHDSCCICFFIFYFFSLSLVPLNCCVFHVKLFKKAVSGHYSVDFLGKWRVFQLESLFRVCTLLYPSSWDF